MRFDLNSCRTWEDSSPREDYNEDEFLCAICDNECPIEEYNERVRWNKEVQEVCDSCLEEILEEEREEAEEEERERIEDEKATERFITQKYGGW